MKTIILFVTLLAMTSCYDGTTDKRICRTINFNEKCIVPDIPIEFVQGDTVTISFDYASNVWAYEPHKLATSTLDTKSYYSAIIIK